MTSPSHNRLLHLHSESLSFEKVCVTSNTGQAVTLRPALQEDKSFLRRVYASARGNVTSVEGGTGGTASANIAVVVPPSIAMAFGAAHIPLNGTTSLTFTITNPLANTVALTGVGFMNTLTAGLVVATPNGLSGTCGGGTITAVAGTGSISLTGATLATGSSCSFSVNVTGTSYGSITNTTDPVTSINGGDGNTASASLAVGISLEIPTMTEWGMILFVFLAGLVSIRYLKRKSVR